MGADMLLLYGLGLSIVICFGVVVKLIRMCLLWFATKHMNSVLPL
jgi:uncharacterized protein YggT (Ycf19 family)